MLMIVRTPLFLVLCFTAHVLSVQHFRCSGRFACAASPLLATCCGRRLLGESWSLLSGADPVITVGMIYRTRHMPSVFRLHGLSLCPSVCVPLSTRDRLSRCQARNSPTVDPPTKRARRDFGPQWDFDAEPDVRMRPGSAVSLTVLVVSRYLIVVIVIAAFFCPLYS